MNLTKLSRRTKRSIRDFLAGLMLFGAVALSGVVDTTPSSGGWIASAAHARLLEGEPTAMLVKAPPNAATATAATSRRQQVMGFISLALALSTIFALNLWFARHMRQAHASYRRRRH